MQGTCVELLIALMDVSIIMLSILTTLDNGWQHDCLILPFCWLHIYDLMLLSSSCIWKKLGRFQISVSWMSRLLSTPTPTPNVSTLYHIICRQKPFFTFYHAAKSFSRTLRIFTLEHVEYHESSYQIIINVAGEKI